MPSLTQSHVTVTGAADEVVAAADAAAFTGVGVRVLALSANDAAVWLGFSSGVSDSNGWELEAGKEHFVSAHELRLGGALYAYAASGAQTLVKRVIG